MVTPALAPAFLPPGQRIYAVGDVHGCVDQLDAMHHAIAADLHDRPVADALVVHLGDYIDRGPDSAGVIGRLIAPFPAIGGAIPRVRNLLGNHEDLLLGALAGKRAEAETWLMNGGHATLASWGVPRRTLPGKWAQTIPPPHLVFLRSLALNHRAGGYLFVHAGVRPGLPINAQTRQDMLWIREPFLSATMPHEAVVVHGHTPEAPFPVLRNNRIGLDTGAVLGGKLSCAVLQADTIAFLQT